jgi:hypothetical protein
VVKQVVVKRVRTACSIHPSFQADPYYRGIWAPACLPEFGVLIAGTARRRRTLLRCFAHLAHLHAGQGSIGSRSNGSQSDRVGNIGRDVRDFLPDGKEAPRTIKSKSFEAAGNLQLA